MKKEWLTVRRFTERTYESEKQFNKASKKLSKIGFKVLKTSVVSGKYVVEYQTKA